MPEQSMSGQPALACQKHQNKCCHQQQQPAVSGAGNRATPITQSWRSGQQGLQAMAQTKQSTGTQQRDQQLKRCEATQRKADIRLQERLLQPSQGD